jgi:serine/threonine protein kinase
MISDSNVLRYMAPELLNPSQFHLANDKFTKESDIYSLAVTAYEVGLSHTAHVHR